MRPVTLAAWAALAVLAALWWAGGFDRAADWALEMQRQAQTEMAGGLRAARAGTPGAVLGLMAVAFLYGVAHAAGPGHGKLVIAGWSAARGVRPGRVLWVAFAASMAQAAVAVGLVYAGVLLLGWTRERMTGLADGLLAQAGTLAVLAIGLVLALRGVLALAGRGHHHHHHHDHDHHHHDHIPDPGAIARAGGPGELIALVAAVAVRPCTGALFLLILTWQMGLALTGIAAAFVMGLGTFVTIAALGALAGALSRKALEGPARLAALRPAVEIGVGLAIALTAALVLARTL